MMIVGSARFLPHKEHVAPKKGVAFKNEEDDDGPATAYSSGEQ